MTAEQMTLAQEIEEFFEDLLPAGALALVEVRVDSERVRLVYVDHSDVDRAATSGGAIEQGHFVAYDLRRPRSDYTGGAR